MYHRTHKVLRDTAPPSSLISCTSPVPPHSLAPDSPGTAQGLTQPPLPTALGFKSPQRPSTPERHQAIQPVLGLCLHASSRLPLPLPGRLVLCATVCPHHGSVQCVSHRKYQNTCFLSSAHSPGYSDPGTNFTQPHSILCDVLGALDKSLR